MRKRISETNRDPIQNYFKEYERIEMLFSDNKCIGECDKWGDRTPPRFTLADYLNDLQFTNWNLRSRYLSLDDMRIGLEIDRKSMRVNFTTERFLDFLQFILNCHLRILITFDRCSRIYITDKNLFDVILDNINVLLENIHYSFVVDKENMEIYIVENNPIATAVCETHEDIHESVDEYRRHDLKGDLRKKAEILCTLYKKLEDVESRFKGTTYNNLLRDVHFLFNNSGVRHSFGKSANGAFEKMPQGKLEEWYDRTYDLFLSCLQISNYLSICDEINELKRVDA